MTSPTTAQGLDRTLVGAWLGDHAAVATAAHELVQRMRGADRWAGQAALLDRIEDAIDVTRTKLHGILDRHGRGAPSFKEAVAWLGERFGRLKPNGHLVTESPATRLVEYHGLLGALHDLHDTWLTLALLELPDADAQPHVARLRGLIRDLDALRPSLVPEALQEN